MTLSKSKPASISWLDAWHVNPAVNRDYDFIDGLRGIAILMVLGCHLVYINPKSGLLVHIIGDLIGTGGYGVTLFFALSGFLISWPFWKQKSAGSNRLAPPGYGWRRFWKIYPPLALSILLLTPVYISLRADWSYLPIAGKWLVGWPWLLPVNGKLNPVMWSLVVEVQFYAALPLAFLCFRRVPAKFCLWILPLVFLVIPQMVRLATGETATFQPNIESHFPVAMDGFSIGIFVAGLENVGYLKKQFARLALFGLCLWVLTLLLVAWLYLHPEMGSFAMNELTGDLGKLAAGCLLFFVADPQHSVARLLCASWLRWCGIVSYEWYLFHQPMIVWAREVFGPAGGSVLRYIAIVGGSFLAGLIITALVYRFFSLPILQRTRVKSPSKV